MPGPQFLRPASQVGIGARLSIIDDDTDRHFVPFMLLVIHFLYDTPIYVVFFSYLESRDTHLLLVQSSYHIF